MAGDLDVAFPTLTEQELASLAARDAPARRSAVVPGVFAAGDVRSGSVKRTSAVGEGAKAVSFVPAHMQRVA